MLANYEVQSLLGRGAFGCVYQAKMLTSNEYVAVKVIKQSFNSWSACKETPEVKCMLKLRHVNIVRMLELVRQAGKLYLVLELCDSDLMTLMKNREGNKMTEPSVADILLQLAKALVYTHKNGFVHRDLKPENILLKGKTIKLADYGIARSIHKPPPCTEYVCTRWYRSPELLLKYFKYGAEVDVWAYGCIAAELWQLCPLFAGCSEHDQLMRICTVLGFPHNHPTIADQLRRICATASNVNAIGINSVLKAESNLSTLVSRCLTWDRDERILSSDLLKLDIFTNIRSECNDTQSIEQNSVEYELTLDSKQINPKTVVNPDKNIENSIPLPPTRRYSELQNNNSEDSVSKYGIGVKNQEKRVSTKSDSSVQNLRVSKHNSKNKYNGSVDEDLSDEFNSGINLKTIQTVSKNSVLKQNSNRSKTKSSRYKCSSKKKSNIGTKKSHKECNSRYTNRVNKNSKSKYFEASQKDKRSGNRRDKNLTSYLESSSDTSKKMKYRSKYNDINSMRDKSRVTYGTNKKQISSSESSEDYQNLTNDNFNYHSSTTKDQSKKSKQKKYIRQKSSGNSKTKEYSNAKVSSENKSLDRYCSSSRQRISSYRHSRVSKKIKNLCSEDKKNRQNRRPYIPSRNELNDENLSQSTNSSRTNQYNGCNSIERNTGVDLIKRAMLANAKRGSELSTVLFCDKNIKEKSDYSEIKNISQSFEDEISSLVSPEDKSEIRKDDESIYIKSSDYENQYLCKNNLMNKLNNKNQKKKEITRISNDGMSEVTIRDEKSNINNNNLNSDIGKRDQNSSFNIHNAPNKERVEQCSANLEENLFVISSKLENDKNNDMICFNKPNQNGSCKPIDQNNERKDSDEYSCEYLSKLSLLDLSQETETQNKKNSVEIFDENLLEQGVLEKYNIHKDGSINGDRSNNIMKEDKLKNIEKIKENKKKSTDSVEIKYCHKEEISSRTNLNIIENQTDRYITNQDLKISSNTGIDEELFQKTKNISPAASCSNKKGTDSFVESELTGRSKKNTSPLNYSTNKNTSNDQNLLTELYSERNINIPKLSCNYVTKSNSFVNSDTTINTVTEKRQNRLRAFCSERSKHTACSKTNLNIEKEELIYQSTTSKSNKKQTEKNIILGSDAEKHEVKSTKVNWIKGKLLR